MPDKEDKESGRGIPDGLREAIEGAFAATEKTRAQAQGLSEKTRDRAQGLVDEVSRRGSDARGTLEGLRLVSRDELRELEDKIEALSSRIAELEAKSKPQVDG
jgi:polyhydroxyalkanoate synthesis regulator phasin